MQAHDDNNKSFSPWFPTVLRQKIRVLDVTDSMNKTTKNSHFQMHFPFGRSQTAVCSPQSSKCMAPTGKIVANLGRRSKEQQPECDRQQPDRGK